MIKKCQKCGATSKRIEGVLLNKCVCEMTKNEYRIYCEV